MRQPVGPWLGAAQTVLLLLAAAPSRAEHRVKREIKVEQRSIRIDGEPFFVRGVCYSPVPINESSYFSPYGDYFTAEYSYLWMRDLPLIKAMGANTIRTCAPQQHTDAHAELTLCSDARLPPHILNLGTAVPPSRRWVATRQ